MKRNRDWSVPSIRAETIVLRRPCEGSKGNNPSHAKGSITTTTTVFKSYGLPATIRVGMQSVTTTSVNLTIRDRSPCYF